MASVENEIYDGVSSVCCWQLSHRHLTVSHSGLIDVEKGGQSGYEQGPTGKGLQSEN